MRFVCRHSSKPILCLQCGSANMPLSKIPLFGKCPTVLTLRANSYTTRYGSIPNKSNALITNYTVFACCLYPDTIKSLEKIITCMQKEIKQLEQKLQLLLEQWQPDQLKNVSSIKGIGKRGAAMLIVFTQGFKNTQNHRQLISFAGLAPPQYSSGSSKQGKPRIYKRGGKNLRDVLYMCSMNAMKTNTACKTLYECLRANGKTGKQALVAVMNKLLKQVFAVVKNNSLYQPNYCSAKP